MRLINGWHLIQNQGLCIVVLQLNVQCYGQRPVAPPLHQCMEEVSDRKLIVPTVTWWNSFYDANARITEIPLTDINNLCTQLQIKRINDREYQFLKEYCSIIYEAFHSCTGHPRWGHLFLWNASTNTGSSHEQHFSNKTWPITNDHWAAWSYCGSNQNFKLRWVKEETRRDHIKFLLMKECRSITPEEPDARCPSTFCWYIQQGGLFFLWWTSQCHGWSTNVSGNRGNVLFQFCTYNGKPAQVSKNYKKALRYNASPPSSAPVERLFSLGSLVLTLKCHRLGDERFHWLVLIRFNRYFSQVGNEIG